MYAHTHTHTHTQVRCFLVLDEDNYLHAFLSPHSLESILVLPLLLMELPENAEAPDALSALEVFICLVFLMYFIFVFYYVTPRLLTP
jgi:hypothetical protein